MSACAAQVETSACSPGVSPRRSCRTINASHPMTIARADTRRSNPASSRLLRSGSIDGVADGGPAQQAQHRGCGSIVAPQPPAPPGKTALAAHAAGVRDFRGYGNPGARGAPAPMLLG